MLKAEFEVWEFETQNNSPATGIDGAKNYGVCKMSNLKSIKLGDKFQDESAKNGKPAANLPTSGGSSEPSMDIQQQESPKNSPLARTTLGESLPDFDPEFSYGKDIVNPANLSYTTLSNLFDKLIKNPKFGQKTSEWRERIKACGGDESKEQKIKKELPYAIFGGVFERRKNTGLTLASGIVALDLDDIEGDVNEISGKLRKRKEILGFYRTIRKKGFRVLFRCIVAPKNDAEYKQYWELAKKFLSSIGVEERFIDKSAKDISRASYLCYDPDAFLNQDAKPLRLGAATTKESKGLSLEDLPELLRYVDADPYHTWTQTIWAVKREYGDESKEIVCEWSETSDKHTDFEFEKVWGQTPEPSEKPVTMGSVIHWAKEGGWEPPKRKQDDTTFLEHQTQPQYSNATDVGNAFRLLKKYQKDLVIEYDKDAVEGGATVYFVQENGLLSRGDSQLRRLLCEVSDEYRREIFECSGSKHNSEGEVVDAGEISDKEMRFVLTHASKLKNAPALKATLTQVGAAVAGLLARDEMGDLTIVYPDQIDADFSVIACANGLVDIATLTIIPPQKARMHFACANTHVRFDPNATHPAVDTVLPLEPKTSSMAALHEYLGWCLTHTPQRDLGAQVTAPNSGKTVIENGILFSLGDYASSMRCEGLQVSRHGLAKGSHTHNGDLFDLASPVRIAIISDAQGGFDTRLLNRLSGGDAKQTARDVGEKRKRFLVTGHMLIQGNTPAPGESFLGIDADSDAGAALIDRLRMFPLDPIPKEERDPTYLNLHTDESYKEAWLARLLTFAQKMIKVAECPQPIKEMQKAVADLEEQEREEWEHALGDAIEPCKGAELNSAEIKRWIQEYWYQHGDEGKMPSPQAATRSITKKTKQQPYRSNRRVKIKERTDLVVEKNSKVNIWDDWKLKESENPDGEEAEFRDHYLPGAQAIKSTEEADIFK